MSCVVSRTINLLLRRGEGTWTAVCLSGAILCHHMQGGEHPVGRVTADSAGPRSTHFPLYLPASTYYEVLLLACEFLAPAKSCRHTPPHHHLCPTNSDGPADKHEPQAHREVVRRHCNPSITAKCVLKLTPPCRKTAILHSPPPDPGPMGSFSLYARDRFYTRCPDTCRRNTIVRCCYYLLHQ